MRESFYAGLRNKKRWKLDIFIFFLLGNTKIVIIHSRKVEIILQEETTSNLLGGEIKFLGRDNGKSFLYFVRNSTHVNSESEEKGR